MHTKEFEIKPVMIKAYCDECNSELQHTYTDTSKHGDVTHLHVCPDCGYAESLEEIYPLITFKETNSEE